MSTSIRKNNKRNIVTMVALMMCLALSVIWSFFIGSVKISPSEIFSHSNSVIIHLRMFRIIMAILAGAGLSVAGIIFQALLRNPLAEPYVLGVSSGSALGAVLALTFGANVLWLGIFWVPMAAFIGGLGAVFMVYALSITRGRMPIQNVLLTGIIVNAILSSILIFLISISPNERLHGVIWWLLGSVEIYHPRILLSTGITVGVGSFLTMLFMRELNAISMGEEIAHHLGVKIETTKRILFLLGSLLTAAVVSACGIIGFVGLIIPHLVRFMVGSDHRWLIPGSIMASAIFLILADALARVVISPAEIPIGAITALLGGPFFIFLMKAKANVK